MSKPLTSIILSAVAATLLILCANEAQAAFYTYRGPDGVLHITNVWKDPNKFTYYAPESGERRDSARSSHLSYDELIHSASNRHGVDPYLVKAIVKAESNFDSSAVSRAGAKGLMQLMPKTARLLGVKNVFDPRENIEGGVRFLRHLIDRFDGRLLLAVAAYNAGESNVRRHGTIPPYKETREFVARVFKYHKKYKQASR